MQFQFELKTITYELSSGAHEDQSRVPLPSHGRDVGQGRGEGNSKQREERQAGYFQSEENEEQTWFSKRRKRQAAYFDHEEAEDLDHHYQGSGQKEGTADSEVAKGLARRQAAYFVKVKKI